MGWVNREEDGSGAWVWEDDVTGQQSDTQPISTAVLDRPSQAPYVPGGVSNAPPRNSAPAIQTGDPATQSLVPQAPAVDDSASLMDPATGRKFMEWIEAGGSGVWDEFRRHVQSTGGRDPGAYSPQKTGGIVLANEDGTAPQVDPNLNTTASQPKTLSETVNRSATPPNPQIPSANAPINNKPKDLGANLAQSQKGTPSPTTSNNALALAEGTTHTFYLKPDGSVVYVKPGAKVPGATPIQLTPEGARKLGWQGIRAVNNVVQNQPTTPVSTPTSQNAASTTRTMYENTDGTVTATPKDQNSTPVQVARPASNKPATPLGPTPGQLEVDKTPMTAVRTGVGQWVNDAPLEAAAKAILQEQGQLDPNDPQAKPLIQQYAKQLAVNMAGYGPLADVALNKIAQLAWYRQTGGQQGAPENAPKEYIESWKGSWRTGALVPLGPSLDQTLIDQGIAPPNVHEAVNKAMQPNAGINPASIDQAGRSFANVQRLAQADQGQYTDNAQWQAWYMASCGAASFAAMVNAANPDRKMTVGEAVNFLKSKNLISQADGLLRGSDFTDISTALNQAIGSQRTQSVNMRTPEEVQKHFASGGGAIMFTGPSGAVWGTPHIYVVTGANKDGVTIVDSSRANKQSLTWDQWRQQTVLPGMGAGAAIISAEQLKTALTTPETPTEINIYNQSQQTQGGALVGSQGNLNKSGNVTGSTRAKEAGTGGSTWNPSVGGKAPGDNLTVQDVDAYDDHVVKDFDLPDTPAPASAIGQEAFMRQWKPTLDRVQQETGLDAGTIMGIIVSESGWGDETARVKSNNYFGMRPSKYDKYATGQNQSNFAVYPNAKSSLARFIHILSHPENLNYKSAWQGRSDPNAFISGLISGGYAPAEENDQSNWRRIILDVANRYRGLQ